jgi:hypothetical protein
VGARVIGCGGSAVAMMAMGSKAAADVRTGHITNHTTGDESYRSTEKRPGSRAKGHVVNPLSSVSRSRHENRGGNDCMAKRLFMIPTPRCWRGRGRGQRPSSPPPRPYTQRGSCQRVPVHQKRRDCSHSAGAANLGVEGIVSKRSGAPYPLGRSTEWLMIKNPNGPAMARHREERSSPVLDWSPTRQILAPSSEGKVQCGRLRRKVIVGSRSGAPPSMKTSPCKSPTVVASRTLSGAQAGLPRRAGSVPARERHWRSRR